MKTTICLSIAFLLTLIGCSEQPAAPAPAAENIVQSETPPEPRTGPMRIALFVPHEDLFWLDFEAFMQAATNQFGMEMRVFVAENSRERMKEQVREATSGRDRFDAVVFQSFKLNGGDLLGIADEAKVPAFLVNADVDEAKWGGPRERFGHWLGTMVSDSVGAGFLLGTLLADEAKGLGLVGADGKVHMIAIGGIVSDQGSFDRLRGLEDMVDARDDVVLDQVVSTDWSFEEGERKAAELLKRFPSAGVVWAASDPLALGAVKSLKAAGREPGVDSVVGGFDWTAEALEAVRLGDLHATLGGEFMAGGWVAVLLHDYLEGRDFAAKQLRFQTLMKPITKENVELFIPAISNANWELVDFDRLASPEGDYDFDAVDTVRRLALSQEDRPAQ